MRRVAIFDIDGTVFRSSLLIEVTEALIEEGVFPKETQEVYAEAYTRWLDREGTYEDYIEGVVGAFLKYIKGVHFEEFTNVAEKVISFHRRRVYRYTRDLLEELREQGYFLLAISKSPKGVVDAFCRELGFHKVYGHLYETGEDGRYTGEVLNTELVADKSKLLARAVEKEGLTLEDSVGVGDTETDIPILEKVTRPICFNPNQGLYTHATQKRWEIVVERKDVIYHM